MAGLMVAMVLSFSLLKDGWTPQTRARVKHLLVRFDVRDPSGQQSALEEVLALRRRLLDGKSFERIAKDFSDDESSAKRGGDLGWVERGDLYESIDEYVWDASLNEVSEVIQSSHGYHLVVVVDRHFSEAELYERGLRDRALDVGMGDDEKDRAPPDR